MQRSLKNFSMLLLRSLRRRYRMSLPFKFISNVRRNPTNVRRAWPVPIFSNWFFMMTTSAISSITMPRLGRCWNSLIGTSFYSPVKPILCCNMSTFKNACRSRLRSLFNSSTSNCRRKARNSLSIISLSSQISSHRSKRKSPRTLNRYSLNNRRHSCLNLHFVFLHRSTLRKRSFKFTPVSITDAVVFFHSSRSAGTTRSPRKWPKIQHSL